MSVLFIDRSNSICGACGKNADPNEPAHTMAIMVGEGCGETYTHLSSHYVGGGIEEAAQNMRPDLPWLDFWAAMAAAR